MRRRDFLALATGAMAWPRVSRAQQPAMPVVGYLSSNAEGTDAKLIRTLQAGLSEQGFIEGKTVAMEYRWSADGYDRLSGLAAELVARKVDVIVASGLPATLAAKAATRQFRLSSALRSIRSPIGWWQAWIIPAAI